MSGLRFDGWVPFRLYWQGSEPGVEWCYVGANRFTEPFFEATIHLEAQTPFNSLFRFRTPLAALADWQTASPGLKPSGFIFHLSRCGSTLITQMLAALPQNLVLSEPSPLDRLLRSRTRVPETAWLRWLVSALGQPRTGEERHLFIKFDSASMAAFPLLREAFPDVPWIFVYRDPVEVMVSNMRAASTLVTRGMLGAEFLNFDEALVAGMEDEEYAARVLGIIAEAAARHAGSAGGMLVAYTQLPGVVWGGLAAHFGISFTPGEVDRMKQAAMLNAKDPKQPFTSDAEGKRKEATDRTRALADQWIMPHYRRLEGIRHEFAAFRRLVLENPTLLRRLTGLENREQFLQAAVSAASEHGIALSVEGVERAIGEALREKTERLL